MNLAEIRSICTDAAKAFKPAGLPPLASQWQADETLPFWVVVVNLKRQPADPKFHSGHATLEAAQQAANVVESESKAAGRDWFKWFAISRPEGGKL